ncbi:hypothetical protein [Ohtaekwangia sp.]|uniref:hypothetical protein n=1 Tax=Ohtaekwangia sp. TaxID=2066019 RepID=UPI002F93FBA3
MKYTGAVACVVKRKTSVTCNVVLNDFLLYVQSMIVWKEYKKLALEEKIDVLYEKGTFIMAIRYYGYKINLYLLGNFYVEVFINHKNTIIEKIVPLDTNHSRMQFYSDQIKLPIIFE